MKKLRIFGLILVLLLTSILTIVPKAYATGNTYYVSTTGNDNNNGSLSTPWRTIQKAASIMTYGDTCLIKAGTYRETVTPTNSGSSGNYITYKPYGDGDVIVSGADTVTGWTQYSGNIYRASVNWTLGRGYNQAFYNNDCMLEARYPNMNYGGANLSFPTYATSDAGSWNNTIGGETYESSFAGQAANYWNGATIHYIGDKEWFSETGLVTASNGTKLTWTRDTVDARMEQFLPGRGYCLIGVLNALDRDGEWYLDATNDYLYFWKPGGGSPSTGTVQMKKTVW